MHIHTDLPLDSLKHREMVRQRKTDKQTKRKGGTQTDKDKERERDLTKRKRQTGRQRKRERKKTRR